MKKLLKQWFCRHKFKVFTIEKFLRWSGGYPLYEKEDVRICSKCDKLVRFTFSRKWKRLQKKVKEIKLEDLHEADFDENYEITYNWRVNETV